MSSDQIKKLMDGAIKSNHSLQKEAVGYVIHDVLNSVANQILALVHREMNERGGNPGQAVLFGAINGILASVVVLSKYVIEDQKTVPIMKADLTRILHEFIEDDDVSLTSDQVMENTNIGYRIIRGRFCQKKAI